ncbi:hypothetical protein RJT34_16523 [Clitoria ternatea]|uniref:Uncharacterized protein n=1 Tax=Clitoria ternatea TaxID=43366 RepID=A0AAN9J8M0_CLITE
MLSANVVGNVLSQCYGCNELEDRCKKAEVMCMELGFELHEKKEHCEALEAKVKALEGETLAIEDELKVLRMLSEGLKREKEVRDGKEGEIKAIMDLAVENEADQLMIENEENGKIQENNPITNEGKGFDFLQNRVKVANFENKEIGANTPSDGIFGRSTVLDVLPDSKVAKQLTFITGESPSKKMAPSTTPIGAMLTSVSVVAIIDSDDEPNITQNPVIVRQGSENIFVSTCIAAEGKNSHSSGALNNKESLEGEDLSFVVTPKRKRSCNVVTSESESDDDNNYNVPICKLKRKTMPLPEVSTDQVRPDLSSSLPATISEDDKVAATVMTRHHRRLLPLRKYMSKSQDDKISSCRPHRVKHQQSIQTNGDESGDDLSYSEEENMSDFIVDDSDVSDSEVTSSKSEEVSYYDVDSDSSYSQDVKDNNVDSNSQDVSDEDMDFGFSKLDAHRGSTLGEFLTDGDPDGDIKKSVEELEEFEPEAVEIYRSLAIHYSKQL